jgi:hypothetical protein
MVGKSRLANAVTQGAQLALFTGAGVTASAIRTNVQNGAARAGLTEAVTVTVTGPSCYCPSGAPPVLGSATALAAGNACTGTCPGSANGPGAFVTIVASYPYQPLMPLLSRLTTPTISESTVVRLL